MPLGRNVSKNIAELYKDNKRSGKARGANGRVRSRDQIIAIAESAARKSKSKKHHRANGNLMLHQRIARGGPVKS